VVTTGIDAAVQARLSADCHSISIFSFLGRSTAEREYAPFSMHFCAGRLQQMSRWSGGHMNSWAAGLGAAATAESSARVKAMAVVVAFIVFGVALEIVGSEVGDELWEEELEGVESVWSLEKRRE
jgi:hypothetical protein